MAGFQEKQIALWVSKDRSPIPPFYPYEHTDASHSERKRGRIRKRHRCLVGGGPLNGH